jgi:hypothetical protein
MNNTKNQKKLLQFIAYFIGGFFVGLIISVIGGYFHNAPQIMWKDTLMLSSGIGILSGFFGDRFLNLLFRIL